MKDIALLVSSGGHTPTRQILINDFRAFVPPTFDVKTHLSDPERKAVRAIGCLFDPVDDALMAALPSLEIVASFGVGYDHVDAQAAAKRGIMVTHTPDVLDDEVADTAIGLLINTVRKLPEAERYLRAGRWETEGSFPLTPLTLRERTVGIFGMGRIGRAIARRLDGFGVSIAYHNRAKVDGSPYRYCGSLVELAQSVDTLINVVPALPSTANAVNADIFAALGPRGVFINVGRGTTVVEADLAQALQSG
ncbi:MAG: NAD(P)-dependent oxidoreductase, partial [Pseudomonadota bacterium]